ncbi:MAG: (2Fe-2S) ferredoxin domain-containing protein [Bacteroidetes bacterium]|nr:(2Fe-2S) ferredoxin domain-containing protein [Bacteroidota bacterium]
MAKMTLEDLRNLREQKKRDLQKRDTTGKNMQIVVGMGTCGIAAGAKKSLDAFISELDVQNLDSVAVTQTGCMGLCYVEPTVEVIVPGMPNVIYGQVDVETARRIIREHIMKQKMVNDHVYDRPAADIIQNGGK